MAVTVEVEVEMEVEVEAALEAVVEVEDVLGTSIAVVNICLVCMCYGSGS